MKISLYIKNDHKLFHNGCSVAHSKVGDMMSCELNCVSSVVWLDWKAMGLLSSADWLLETSLSGGVWWVPGR